LTQAGWSVGGKFIDHTRYFRHDLFGKLRWRVIKTSPRVEEAQVRFEVKVLGQPLGSHTLAVSHKPSGEAGQRNYTSLLHWKQLAGTIRDLRLASKLLAIYEATDGTPGTFFLEIS
jgi:hypothetical protein